MNYAWIIRYYPCIKFIFVFEMGKTSDKSQYLQVKFPSVSLKKELIAIQKNEGFSTLTAYILHVLRKDRDSKPPEKRIYIE